MFSCLPCSVNSGLRLVTRFASRTAQQVILSSNVRRGTLCPRYQLTDEYLFLRYDRRCSAKGVTE